jgi:hypothetical protein
MPRYFFDLEFTGGGYFDQDGIDLPDQAYAISHAEADARHIMGDYLLRDRPIPLRTIIVRNLDRQILARIGFDDVLLRVVAELRRPAA